MRYRTLHGEVIDLNSLPDHHRKVYEEAAQLANQGPEWTSFTNFWIQKIREIGDSAESALFRILQDIDSRLSIRQGFTRLPNWREELDSIIENRFPSRYKFCKVIGVDEAHLSAVLKGKKNFSIPNLIRMLDKIGFRMLIVETDVLSTGEE